MARERKREREREIERKAKKNNQRIAFNRDYVVGLFCWIIVVASLLLFFYVIFKNETPPLVSFITEFSQKHKGHNKGVC